MSSHSRRREAALDHAVRLIVQEKLSLRVAVSRTLKDLNFRIDRSTLSRRLKKHQAGASSTAQAVGRPPALSKEQEKHIAETCLYFSLRGVPLIRDEVAYLVKSSYGNLPSFKARFKNGLPGRDWLKSFIKRHRLSFIRPSRQDAERYRCTSAEALTSHLCIFQDLLNRFSIDPTRLFNLDETGMSPERDCHGNSSKKVVGQRGDRCVSRGTDFKSNLSRVSLLGCISAAGEAVLPMWIFKGKRFPFRVRKMPDGSEKAESAAHLLPPGSLHGTRPEIGGVDSRIFVAWCKHFVLRIEHLTRGGKKVLLVFDAYRAHMSLECLLILKEGNVEVYAIPAHTSGVTQPLDVGVFSSFKRNINNYLLSLTEAAFGPVSLFEMCSSFSKAYDQAFTRENIMSGFSKSGLWPFSPEALLCRPLPMSKDNIESIVNTATMIQMVKDKRRDRIRNLDRDSVSIRRGFIDTTHGALLTSEEAIAAVAQKEKASRHKSLSMAQRRTVRQIAQQKKADSVFELRTNAASFIQKHRARRFGVSPDDMPKLRSLALRRAVARAKTLRRRHGQSPTQ